MEKKQILYKRRFPVRFFLKKWLCIRISILIKFALIICSNNMVFIISFTWIEVFDIFEKIDFFEFLFTVKWFGRNAKVNSSVSTEIQWISSKSHSKWKPWHTGVQYDPVIHYAGKRRSCQRGWHRYTSRPLMTWQGSARTQPASRGLENWTKAQQRGLPVRRHVGMKMLATSP
jgi:hypothetical protein